MSKSDFLFHPFFALNLARHDCLVTLGKGHDSPLAVPAPFAGTRVAAAVGRGLELLVLAFGQTDDHIGLDGAQRHDVGARGRTHGAESLGVRCGRVPPSLHPLAIYLFSILLFSSTCTYITSQLAVVEIALEDDELRLLEVVQQIGPLVRQAPEAAASGPVAIRAHDELSLGMGPRPVLKDKLEVGHLLVRQLGGRLALPLVVLGRRLEKGARVLDGVEQAAEVGRQHVRDEPGDRLGAQHNLRGQARGQQEAAENEVDPELEAGIVEDKVDAALGLAGGAGRAQRVVHRGQVVGDDVLLGRLARGAALHLLNVLVRHVGEQGQVSGVAPEADLEHFSKERLFGVEVVRGFLAFFELGDEFLVAGREFQDGVARGAERVHLLAVKEIVLLPVLGGGEKGAYTTGGCQC